MVFLCDFQFDFLKRPVKDANVIASPIPENKIKKALPIRIETQRKVLSRTDSVGSSGFTNAVASSLFWSARRDLSRSVQ